MNALKSGIYSKSLTIPGENPADLDTLRDEYFQRYHPALPEQRDQVDIIVRSTWTLRRLAVAEAQVWTYSMDARFELDATAPLGHALTFCDKTLTRLHRIVNSTQRNCRDALRELERLQALDPRPRSPARPRNRARSAARAPNPQPPTPNPRFPRNPLKTNLLTHQTSSFRQLLLSPFPPRESPSKSRSRTTSRAAIATFCLAIASSTRSVRGAIPPRSPQPPGMTQFKKRPVPGTVKHPPRSFPIARPGHAAPCYPGENPRPTMKNHSEAGEKFQKLVELMARLRAPGGCPWDREQTFDSIKPYTLEETYEVLDAIDRRDWHALAEELGDFLLQAVFYAQMAAEEDLFTIDDALDAINQKLVRRHPHVFGDESAETAGDVKRIWGEVKAAERERTRASRSRWPAGPRAALPSRPGGGAADHLARRRRGLRLGESRAGARQAARRAGRIRRGAAQRIARPNWRTNSATCCSCWSTWRASSRWTRSRPCARPTRNSAGASATSSANWRSAARSPRNPTSRKWRRCGRKRKRVIEIRQLSQLEEFAEVLRLQQVIWGFADSSCCPAVSGGGEQGRRPRLRRFRWRAEPMVGFCFAIPGVKPPGRPYLHSHMLGVLPAYHNAGIGRRLKLRQREEALARGIELIEWTFDPLELKNAFFNIERLGAIVRRYDENQYGVTASPLHGGLPTDRCIAEWWLDSPRVRATLAREKVEHHPVERISYPADIARIRSQEPRARAGNPGAPTRRSSSTPSRAGWR